MERPWKVGLVELHVELLAGTSTTSRSLAVAESAAAAPRRAAQVEALLADERWKDLDVIVFPGWTLPGTTLPAWALAASHDRVIVLELVDSTQMSFATKASKTDDDETDEETGDDEPLEFPWTTYVLHRGRAVVAAHQAFASGGQASAPRRAQLLRLLGEDSPGQRVLDAPPIGRIGLLVCGEVNVVAKRGGVCAVPGELEGLDLVVNPAHTPGRLQAMRDKRQAISAGRVLVTTANTHSRWNHAAAHVAAECYVDGERLSRGDVRTIDGGALVVHEVKHPGR